MIKKAVELITLAITEKIAIRSLGVVSLSSFTSLKGTVITDPGTILGNDLRNKNFVVLWVLPFG